MIHNQKHLALSILIFLFGFYQKGASQNVAAGSLIIPMDDSLTVAKGGQDEIIKAYGLVYKLLSQSSPVPVKWAYSTSKIHSGTDFTCAANQVKIRFGNSLITTAFNYRGGPFIIDVADTAAAGPLIRLFQQNDVTVHQVVTAFTGVPIQHTMNKTPTAFVESRNAGKLELILDVFEEAEIPSTAYDTSAFGVPPVTSGGPGGPGGGRNLSDPTCYTIVMIPHEDNMTAQDAQNIVNFANDGGNVFLECHAIKDFENNFSTRKLTTTGIDPEDDVTWAYPNAGAQIHLGQFVGTAENKSGSVTAWDLPSGGSYASGAQSIVQKSSNQNYNKVMFIQPANSGFYCYAGGHEFKDKKNLSRILLNAFLAPSERLTCSPLPVELVSFVSEVTGKSVRLKWRTATEVNNYGFEVQRSTKGNDWIPIAFIQGHGTVNTSQSYSYVDENIGQFGTNFRYRLKQIDRDSKTNYSPIVEANFNAANRDFGLRSVYPNPINPTAIIQFYVPIKMEVTLKIYDLFGREVKELMEDAVKTEGTYSIMLDAKNIPSGIYYAWLTSGDSYKSVYKLSLLR